MYYNESSETCSYDIYYDFQTLENCESCGRRSIAYMYLEDTYPVNDRKMGQDYMFEWIGSYECKSCKFEKDDLEDSESIYMIAEGTVPLNAFTRHKFISQEHIQFDLWGETDDREFYVNNQDKGDCAIFKIGTLLVTYDLGFKKYKDNFLLLLGQTLNNITTAIIVISHDDQDHKGNYETILEVLKERDINTYLLYEENDLPNILCVVETEDVYEHKHNKVVFSFEDVKITAHYADSDENDKNLRSIVLIIELFEGIICMTGDQHMKNVNSILDQYESELLLLQLPHHGSKHSHENCTIPRAKNYLISGKPNYKESYVKECQQLLIDKISEYEGCKIHINQPFIDHDIIVKPRNTESMNIVL
eukprot:TRINITY_DN9126_c0_g1_i1.p1 TRINITY_DN9126_c0_g1~~TRINITY_DN9126_c0_g1_i1.p1  ORF type:complete len:362 (+),score=49.68 TRINITY_DN9126_c0_g1_i1:57-1142(+)